MAKRRTISKRTRFDVFKRDKFRCQYCGKEAPSVVLSLREIPPDADAEDVRADGLHVDHVVPRAAGGEDTITNYVTACVDCNLGKGPIPLDDDAAVRKQRAQMEDVAARREQVEMMAQWQRDLAALDASGVDVAVSLWESLVPGTTLNVVGQDIVAKALRRFGPEAVLDAMRTAIQSYAQRGQDGAWDNGSLSHALNKIAGICVNRRKQETLPELPQLYYIRGILKNRFPERWDNAEVMRLLQRAVRAGMSVEALQDHARDASTYWRWKNETEEDIASWETRDAEERDTAVPAGPSAAPPSPLTRWVFEWATARWESPVSLDDVRLRTERNSYTTTRPLWMAWSTRHAVTFEHWCAMMDLAEAADRIEEMMLALPVPPYPAIMPKDLSAMTVQVLDRVMKAAVSKFGAHHSKPAIAQDIATSLLFGFEEADIMRTLAESHTMNGWWVDVSMVTTLAMRLRAPHDPFGVDGPRAT
ncbi:HNH endonuclease [Gemmatimonas sp.]|uniref:HNH endonuclease n=1 Tax=Gemmatimonas sp. TaxID=1962908 RepID=UPI003F70BEE9